jgi:phosphotriesterase-related protein
MGISAKKRAVSNVAEVTRMFSGDAPASCAVSRREAVRRLGMGAGLRLVALWATNAERVAASWQAGGTSVRKATFPKGAIIRTLLKDLPPEALANGVTLFHEHLSEDLPPLPGAPPKRAPSPTTDVDYIIQETNQALKEGVVCLVEGSSYGQLRKMEDLRQIAAATTMHVVVGGGYYMGARYPADFAIKSEDQIVEQLLLEAKRDRLGAYGEIGEDSNAPMSALERKVFRAIGKAHLRTNLPIFTHNAYGTGPDVPREAGLVQLDVFESVGVKPKHVAIGHSCCLDDPSAEIIKQVAKRGAFVGFDRVLGGRVPDDKKIKMILEFLHAGYADKLLLSTDYNGLRSETRPGYASTLTTFAPKLRQAGVKDETLQMILRDNPRHFLAFVPKKFE